jgi:hypothetical protein
MECSYLGRCAENAGLEKKGKNWFPFAWRARPT